MKTADHGAYVYFSDHRLYIAKIYLEKHWKKIKLNCNVNVTK